MTKERLWRKNFILIMIVSLFSGFMVNFFTNTMPVYAENMTHTAVYAGLVTTTYTVAALATRPLIGVACERFDSKRLIICGIVLMTISCFGYMFAASIWMVLFVRIIHGIGFGIKTTASGVLVADIIPKSRFAEGIGMFGLYLPVTNAIGPAVGLYITEAGKFNMLFITAGVIGCTSLILMMCMKKSKADISATVDDKRIEDEEITFEQVEEIKLPKTFLKFEFGVVYPSAVLALTYFGYAAIISFIALYGRSEGISGIGLFFTIGAIALFISRYIFAKLVKRYGYHRFVIVSLILFAAVLVIIPYVKNIYILYCLSVFYGIALGIVPMAVNAQVLERCSVKRRGTATAAYTSAMDIGIGLGSIVLGVLVEMSGYKWAFGFAGFVTLLGAGIYMVTVMRDHEEYKRRIDAINDSISNVSIR